jgi:hypothetical protein
VAADAWSSTSIASQAYQGPLLVMVGRGRGDIQGTRAVGGSQTRRLPTTAGLGY